MRKKTKNRKSDGTFGLPRLRTARPLVVLLDLRLSYTVRTGERQVLGKRKKRILYEEKKKLKEIHLT